jgi:hypothetical protein
VRIFRASASNEFPFILRSTEVLTALGDFAPPGDDILTTTWYDRPDPGVLQVATGLVVVAPGTTVVPGPAAGQVNVPMVPTYPAAASTMVLYNDDTIAHDLTWRVTDSAGVGAPYLDDLVTASVAAKDSLRLDYQGLSLSSSQALLALTGTVFATRPPKFYVAFYTGIRIS